MTSIFKTSRHWESVARCMFPGNVVIPAQICEELSWHLRCTTSWTEQARFFLSVRSENGSEYEPCALRGMLGSFIHHLNRKSYNVSLFDDVRFSSMRESLKSNHKQLKKIGKGNQPMRAELLTHTELDKLYKSQKLGLSTSSSLLNTLWLNNCTNFGWCGSKQEYQALC